MKTVNASRGLTALTLQVRILQTLTLAALMGLALCPKPAQAQSTVYNQPADFPTSSTYGSRTSNYDPTMYGTIWTTYDNFTLTSPKAITGLTWQGYSFDYYTSDPTSTTPSSFTIDFLSDNAGTPGTVLFTQQVSYTSSAAGSASFDNGQTYTIYDYAASLSDPFMASGNTPLWLAVIGNENHPAWWTWMSGEGGDGASYQTLNPAYGDFAAPVPNDRTFSLQTTPEPASYAAFVMGGFGLLGLGLKARRRSA